MSKKFIDLLSKLKTISTSEDKDIDLEEAAVILLQFNKNRILYENIRRGKLFAKLRYEAGKTFALECARRGLNPESFEESPEFQMKQMEEKVKSVDPSEEKEKTMGKRADHDSLPDNIRLLFDQNTEKYLRMRQVHEILKGMDAALPCDRFPYVKELLDLDDQVASGWEKYDSFILPSIQKGNDVKTGSVDFTGAPATPIVPIDAKRISANRKYISDNKEKLAALIAANDPKAKALRDKIQVRVDELLKANAGVSDEQLSELAKLGINV